MYFELPVLSPHRRNVVRPLTDPVTRPLCFWMRFVASWRYRDSRVPEMTKVLPFRHSGCPSGYTCSRKRDRHW